MKLYFAYGSNMWNEQMKNRCPDSKKIGRANLPGYRWIITSRGYASVVPAALNEVEGVLFELSDSDEAALDRYEGVSSHHYFKAELPILMDDREVMALVYIDPISEEGPPKQEYIQRINAGLADAGLTESYVTRQIRKFVPETADP